jgi:putative phosphoesterase
VRIAALADIHGNLPALEAVLAEVDGEKPDLIVVCGDLASGPMPAETIDLLQTLRHARFVSGNADRGLIEAFDGKNDAVMPGPFADWCAKQISREQRDFLASFEPTVTIDDVDGLGRVLFCHASPRNDVDIFTAGTPTERVRTLMADVTADIVVCGHTHMQFDREVDGLRVINPGSVGMPYGEPGAHWAMLGPDVKMRRTAHDLEAAAARIRALSWPMAAEFARDNVFTVPTVGMALDSLSKAEARQLQEGTV